MIDVPRPVARIIADMTRPSRAHASTSSGTFNNPALNRALAEEGLLERAVPGLGMGDPIELWVLFNELEKAGAPLRRHLGRR